MTEEARRLGRYEVIRPIAAGGMARVFLGRALGAGGFQRLVAIKVMHPHIARDPDFEAMFLDEGRIAAGIHHPNVVATLDIDKGDDGLYMVLEYVAGASLAVLARDRLPLPIVLRIALDALAGLQAAHALHGPDGQPLHVVHRDISPQNILVGVDGIARISDFGIARAETRMSRTREGQVKGKLAYMSPEQLRGDPLDARSDIFSMGVVLWELLTGARLFHADNEPDLIMAVLAGPARRPRDVSPDVPAGLDAVCMRALASKGSRHPSAELFAAALRDAAAAAGVAIAEPGAVGALAAKGAEALGPLPPLPASRVAETPAAAAAADPIPPTEAPDSDLAATLLRQPAPAQSEPTIASPAVTPRAPARTLQSEAVAPLATTVAIEQVPEEGGTTTANIGMVRSAPEPPARASRGSWLAIVGVLALIAAAVWVFFERSERGQAEAVSPEAPPASTPASTPAATATSSAAPPSSSPAAAPSASIAPPKPRTVTVPIPAPPPPIVPAPAPSKPRYRPETP